MHVYLFTKQINMAQSRTVKRGSVGVTENFTLWISAAHWI